MENDRDFKLDLHSLKEIQMLARQKKNSARVLGRVMF